MPAITGFRSGLIFAIAWHGMSRHYIVSDGLGNRRSIQLSYGTAICFQRVTASRKIVWHPADILASAVPI